MTLTLDKTILDEIERIAVSHDINSRILRQFAEFTIVHERNQKRNKKKKESRKQTLSLIEIKKQVFDSFDVKNTTQLRKAGAFKMATDGMEKLNLRLKEDWEKIYREVIGILPGEENEVGYGCINGVNVFKYDRPWQVFGLDPKQASVEEIKKVYRKLSKIYHPDVAETGNAEIFDRLTILYKSIATEV